MLLVAIGLVRRRDDDLRDLGAAPAGFQQRPCPLDVGLERRDGVAVGDADDGLRRQMKDGVDLMFAQRPLQQRLVAHVAAHQFDFVDHAAADQFALRHPVAHQADDVRPGRHAVAAPASCPPVRSRRSPVSGGPARTIDYAKCSN